MNNKKLRLAWFTPTNKETISENFSAVILPELESYFHIEVFTDSFDQYKHYSTKHFLQYLKEHKENPYDLFIYQLENHKDLNFSRTACGLMPGMTIFHHFNFLNYGPEPILNSPWQKIISRFLGEKIDWPTRGDKFFQQGPTGYRESAFSLIPAFTNPLNATDFKNIISLSNSKKYNISSSYIPFPVKEVEINTSKGQKIAYSGSPSVPDRAHKLLEAINLSDNNHSLVWMVSELEVEKAKELLTEFEINDCELVVGRNVDNWSNILKEASLAVHLQFSVFDQPCPYLPVSMMNAVPVILNSFNYADALPDIVFKINPGREETLEIKNLLDTLYDKNLETVSNEIRKFAIENHSAKIVAKDFFEIVNSNIDSIREFYADWDKFTKESKEALIEEVKKEYEDSTKSSEFDENFSWDNVFLESYKELGWK